jgi:hypothetical protein
MRAITSRIIAVVVAAIAAAAFTGAGAAHAGFDFNAFDSKLVDAQGNEFNQAGGHPYALDLSFSFNGTETEANGGGFPDGSLRNLVVDLPAGFAGNLQAVPTCSRFDLADGGNCSPATQIGVMTLDTRKGNGQELFTVGLYNVVPRRGKAAEFGFYNSGLAFFVAATVRPDTNAVRTTIADASQAVRIKAVHLQIWGVPADPAHDPQRGPRYQCPLRDLANPDCSNPAFYSFTQGGNAANVAPQALLSNPTACGAPLTTQIIAESWQDPGVVKQRTVTSDVGGTGCDRVPFAPTLDVEPSTMLPDAPTGLSVRLGFPQSGLVSPSGIATAHLRHAKVTLPEGMTINPGGAAGLTACSDTQLKSGVDAAVECPESSKIGTATATTPLLAEPLTGGVYVAQQLSDDPESGEMFRIFLNLADPERGIDVKLVGKLRVNGETGRVEASFTDNPQLPVDTLEVAFKSGPRAPLATPPTCGTKTVDAELTSWSDAVVRKSATFSIACTTGLGAFAPAVGAGVSDITAGGSSPFFVGITKPDGQSALNGLTLTLPTGLLARLKGNLGTQVGTVKAYAGPGSNPFMLPGQVFLEGAYGDAPFSLRVVVPAKAGPFDLGEVVVRQKIYVDPIDAHVTVISDPLPTIVKGVPVRLQRLDVDVDKPGFMINPTSCGAKAIGGTLHAAGGQAAPIDVRFQVGGCGSLALKPSLALSLSGKGQTTDGKHPAITATLTQPASQANLKKVMVKLPLSLALDPDNSISDSLCSFVEGSKPDPKCPASSIVGKATATTPILDEPLSGPVYFVKNERKDPKSGRSIRTLPKLVIPFTGQNGVKLTLTGTSTVVDDQLVTTFDNIPDAPVSSFKMNIIGGKGGILTVSGADICKATQVVDQQVDGQNNKQADADVYIQTPSCPTKVLSKKVGKTSVTLKVGGLGAGKVTVTGRGIKKTTKSIAKSTVATITAKRTKGKPGKVTVSFDPAGPAKARKTTK